MPGHEWFGGLRPDEVQRLYDAVHTDPRDARIAELESQLAAANKRAEEAESDRRREHGVRRAVSGSLESVNDKLTDARELVRELLGLLYGLDTGVISPDQGRAMCAQIEVRAERDTQ